jgi:hypothetical protein
MSGRVEPRRAQPEPLAGSGRKGSATEAFVAHRNLLFTVAYELLGSGPTPKTSCSKPGCGG